MEFELNLLSNVYRIFGDNEFEMQMIIEKIKEACGKEMPEINQSFFNEENFVATDLIACCNQLPFLNKKKFVCVSNLSKLDEQEKNLISNYCKNPNATTVLVFKEKVGENTFPKMQSKQIECKKLNGFALEKFAIIEAQKLGKVLDQQAAKKLVEYTSSDQIRVLTELKKLQYYNLNNQNISVEDIEKLVNKTDDFSVFELSEFLAKGDKEKAISLLSTMLKTMEPASILGLVSAYFRRVLYSKISGQTDAEIASHLNVKEFAITKAKIASKNFSAKTLMSINSLLLETEYNFKIGKGSAENLLYALIFQILQLKND